MKLSDLRIGGGISASTTKGEINYLIIDGYRFYLDTKVKYLEKKVAALEEANTYLHELREVFVVKELYEIAAKNGCSMFQISQIYQPLKEEPNRYIWDATYIQAGQHHRSVGPSFEELESNLLKKFKGVEIVSEEEDEDLL